jgi:hypothetical protein
MSASSASTTACCSAFSLTGRASPVNCVNDRRAGAVGLAPGRDQLRQRRAAAGADLLAAQRRHVLELGGTGLLHEEQRAVVQIIHKGRAVLSACDVGHPRQDRIDPAGGDRWHHLVEAGFLPGELDAELAAERLAQFDIESGQRAGGEILEFHRRIIRHDGDLDAALLDDFRRQFGGRDRTGGEDERDGKQEFHRVSSIYAGGSKKTAHRITAERKAWVRASRGSPRTSAAAPDSTMAPWSM